MTAPHFWIRDSVFMVLPFPPRNIGYLADQNFLTVREMAET